MSRKNSTVVAVAVHKPFNVGDRIFFVDGRIENVIVNSRPYFKHFKDSDSGAWWIELIMEGTSNKYVEAMGDAGVPGFKYDKRPSRFARTIEEAEQALKDWELWDAGVEERQDQMMGHLPYGLGYTRFK